MMININDIKRDIHELFNEISENVEKSRNDNEEKLRVLTISSLISFFKKFGIDLAQFIELEKSSIGTIKVNGRVDALYGSCIVEFKKVGLLSTKKQREKAIQQVIKRYLDPIPNEKNRSITGVIFDGNFLIFIRWDKKREKWIKDIRKFDEYSLFKWILLLTGTLKKQASIKTLKKDFGLTSRMAREFIATFYKKLEYAMDNNERVKMLFDEWDKTFRYVYGGVLDEDKIKRDFQELAEKIRISNKHIRTDYFLFVMYTYYSLIIKLFASEMVCVAFDLSPESVTKRLLQSKNLQRDLRYIEEGKFFKDYLGVDNYIEGGFFSWYLDTWDEEIEEILKKILMKIGEYDSRSFIEEDWIARDLLKKLYQEIVPQKIRHDLGEYYTPDWVIELVLDEIGYVGDPKYKILDPGCGSGGFLVEIINRIKSFVMNNKEIDENKGKQLLRDILNNVVGFDVNPVAVLTARTNYLLSILPLIKFREGTITIPVFLTDSIITPTTEGSGELQGKFYQISTVEGLFLIPKSIVENGCLEEFLEICDHSIENEYPTDDFLELLSSKLQCDVSNEEIEAIRHYFYDKLLKLHKNNKNKIWIKIIQNSFAPLLFQNKFDYIVGNPPWIKWEFLSPDYRKKLGLLYLKVYRLYSYNGMKAGLGFAHDDISIVFTYVCIDKYLKQNGKLGFVLKQTLYKSIAGKEFRKFFIEKENEKIPLKVIIVHDLVKLKPFKRSGSETSVIIIEKGKQTQYPVQYKVWKLKKEHKLSEITDTSSLNDVKRITITEDFDAYPDPSSNDPTDVWILVPKGLKPKKSSKKLNPYEIRHGVVNDLNGVFFIQVMNKNLDGSIQITNLHDLGRKKVEKVTTSIEPDLVYPVLKPRHIKKWRINGYYYMIVPQKKAGEKNERMLRVKYPKTYAYLARFKDELLKRSSRWFKGNKPFYSLFGIGEYTFSPYKVVWCPMVFPPAFAVASYVNDEYIGNKVYIPDNTIGYIPFNSEDEAHYVCAILNSSKVLKILERTSSKSKWAVSISAIKQIPIPKYDPQNEDHRILSFLSKKAHYLASGKGNKLGKLVEELIDGIVEKIL